MAGVSVWTTVSWDATNEQLREHYTRSLQAERIRAAVFRSTKEIPDALAAEDDNARQEFQEAIARIDEDFETWANLADTQQEQRQVQRVRQAYSALVEDSRNFFGLIEAGRRQEARELMERQLEENSF